jgi:chemotaxis receptor (MCP) glutamine deamidase CheD
MEGTRRGRESARKIFEMGARSGQTDAKLLSEGRVEEEQAERKAGKTTAKFVDKMEGREECRILTECLGERTRRKRRERSTTGGTGMSVKMWKD